MKKGHFYGKVNNDYKLSAKLAGEFGKSTFRGRGKILAVGKQTESDRIYIVWIIMTLMLTVIAFVSFASTTIYIDPLFHYHKPLENYEYPLNNERYQNDGITRNFEYDSIITGSSMVENFKASQASYVFDADFIKIPFSGGRYKEINDNLQRAYDAGKNIKYVIRCLDYSVLVQDKDSYREDFDYPIYLYNDNLLDDVNYVLNKSIFLNRTRKVIKYTDEGNETTNFDDYVNWNSSYTFGAKAVLDTYTLDEKAETVQALSEDERITVLENIRQNVTDLADAHPETTFYMFFPPYSICYWEVLDNNGQIDWRIDAEQVAIEEILKHPNIKLYSFCSNFELVCDLNNYKDQAHYGEWVNSRILAWMYDGKYLLTQDNYEEYIETIREFYNSYDYASLRK